MIDKQKRNEYIAIGIILGVVLYSIVLYSFVHLLHVPVR
jgi:hypothetical protein